MIIGQLLIAASDQAQGDYSEYYSPWFPSGGNAATFACDVIAQANMAELQIDVQTKNSEQSDKSQGSFVPANGNSNGITLANNTTTKFTVGAALSSTTTNGLLELVRFRFRLQAAEGFAGEGFVHLRMLEPAWLTN